MSASGPNRYSTHYTRNRCQPGGEMTELSHMFIHEYTGAAPSAVYGIDGEEVDEAVFSARFEALVTSQLPGPLGLDQSPDRRRYGLGGSIPQTHKKARQPVSPEDGPKAAARPCGNPSLFTEETRCRASPGTGSPMTWLSCLSNCSGPLLYMLFSPRRGQSSKAG